MDILENLSEIQRKIVTDTEGAVLVLAGAGSGKTRVLTHRVAYLVKEKGIYPSQILAITFTNKATAEMKGRLDLLLGDGHGVWISTFHSLAARILRKYGERLGYESNFSIYDESDSARVVGKALREKHLDGTPLKDSVRGYISDAKNQGLTPQQYYEEIVGAVEHAREISEVYERYEELLLQANAMDFDDLLQKLKLLLITDEEALAYYQNKFRYVHVDEFQDTNKVQYEIVKLLAGKWGNLFVVGDDDQSIYGWRGAEVTNILNFDKEIPNVKVYKLLENYRSTSKILTAANNVIRNNKARHEKELYTNRGDGVRVEYYNGYNDYQEADWVIGNIGSLKSYYGYANSDFAILVRANSLTRIFENKLSSSRFTYRVLGGFKFFDRKEIQDVIAYLRMISNHKDNEAVERIINVPARGIGDTTVQRLAQYAREHSVPLFDVLLEIEKYTAEFGNGLVNKTRAFTDVISDLVTNSRLPLKEFAEYLVARVGFEYAYTSTGKEDDFVRWENIQQFLVHIKEYVAQNPTATLDTFLQTVSLAPESKDELYDTDKITVATMHAVKGLEFKVVFIVGCEEDIFPTAQSKKTNDIEEERRVMYVAITRARERLYISCAQRRFRFNRVQEGLPSRFMSEAKGEQREDPYAVYGERKAYLEGRGDRPSYWNDEPSSSKIVHSAATQPPQKRAEQPKPSNKDLSGYIGGAKVRHPVYGEGTILMVLGKGADVTATVAFPNLGVKKFLLQLAPLTLVK